MATTYAIVKVAGDNQEQGVAGDLLRPLTVCVTDASTGHPVASAAVAFAFSTIPTGATMQALSAATVNTGADGTASVTATLGEIGGLYQVTASVQAGAESVVFSAYGIALSAFADLRAYMGATDTTHDALWATWLGEASVEIEKRLAFPVMPRPIEEFISGTGETRLYTDKGRIIELTRDNTGSVLGSLQIRNSALDAWANLVENEAYIYIDPVHAWRIELTDYRIFPIGLRNIRVAYLTGMNPVPGDLHEMSQQMVQMMWNSTLAGGNPRLGMSGRNRTGGGAGGGDTFKDMEPEWQPIIDRYRRLL